MKYTLWWIMFTAWMVATGLVVSGCGLSDTQIAGTMTTIAVEVQAGWTAAAGQRTAIARDIFASQTAAAPTYTPIETHPPLPTRTPTPLPTTTRTRTPTPSQTPPPSATLTETPIPNASVLSNKVGMYDGPSRVYARTDDLYIGEPLEVLGQAYACEWLYVRTSETLEGWVTGSDVKMDIPCAALPWHTYRPLNGEIAFNNQPAKGKGELEVKNGTDRDGLLILTLNGSPVLAFFVRANNDFILKELRDGSYDLYFCTGENWNGGTGAFETVVSYQKFDEPFLFTTSSVSYTIWSITMHPVAGGTGSTTNVPADRFPDLNP